DAIGEAIARADEDHAFAAQLLMPPSEGELAMAMMPADPDSIHAARFTMIRAVNAVHGKALAALYSKLGNKGPFSPDAKSEGRRALRHAALRYLTSADDDAAATLADTHYRDASNMTDMIAGLAALSRMASSKREAAFAHFHDRFKANPLVLDKWLSLQA